MDNEITNTAAIEVHREIINNGALAATAFAEMCRNLKRMRDEKLYIDLGYKSFDDYCDEMANIKSRMAYNYISVYEKLGPSILQSNANLGITKLELIAQLPPSDRADAFDQAEMIEGMTVSEVKEYVAKSRQFEKQLNIFEQESVSDKKEIKDLTKTVADLKKDIKNKTSEITDLKNQPVTVVEDVTAEKIDEIRRDVEKEFSDKMSDLEKRLKLNDNDTVLFKMHLDILKTDFQKLQAYLGDVPDDKQAQYKSALIKLLNIFIDGVK